MSKWRSLAIEDLAAKSKSALATGPFGSAVSKKHFVDHGVPMIRGSNLSIDVGVRLDDSDLVYLPEEVAGKFERSTARAGDLVFTCWGTIGQIGLIDESCRFDRYIVSNKQMKMTPDDEIVDSRFLYYALSSPDNLDQVQRQAIGAAVPGFNLGQLRQIRVDVPDLPTQQIIARILRSIDDLIENNRRRIGVLEEMAQAIYREWFVHFRFPGHENATFVNSPLGPIPEGWEALRLGEVVNTQYGYTESASDLPIGPKYLRGTDINKTSFIDWHSVPYCPITPSDYEKFRINPGDVFVIRMADPGKVGICEQRVDAVFASYLVRLRPRDDRVSPLYLFFTLNSDQYQSWVSGASSGATRKSVSAKVMVEPFVAVPDKSSLSRFENSVAPLRLLISTLVQSNAKLSLTRNTLLPKLVSGEIGVSELDLDAVLEGAV